VILSRLKYFSLKKREKKKKAKTKQHPAFSLINKYQGGAFFFLIFFIQVIHTPSHSHISVFSYNQQKSNKKKEGKKY